jgi:hypothetical protein
VIEQPKVCSVVIYSNYSEIALGGIICGEAQRKIFFCAEHTAQDFYKYLMKFYILFLAAWAAFAVFYLTRDRSKDAERQRLSDLY